MITVFSIMLLKIYRTTLYHQSFSNNTYIFEQSQHRTVEKNIAED